MDNQKFEDVHGVTTDGWVYRIEHTFVSGVLAGLTMRKGYIETHPQHGVGVKFNACDNPALAALLKKMGSKDKLVFARLSSNPDLKSAIDEVERRQKLRADAAKAKLDAEQEMTRKLVRAMEEEEAVLLAKIPADHVRVLAIEDGTFDGDRNYRYAADGIPVRWNTPGVVNHGSAFAKYPNAMNSFAVRQVLSISRADLDAFVAAVKAEEDAKTQVREAKRNEAEEMRRAAFELARTTGKRMPIRSWSEMVDDEVNENSLDIVTEYALPDGTTRTERSGTY